ncbi:hypothetical protein [Desulfobacter vibrioformis]|uniref:hypothetical protein n=1 Tax=Desulfobacter vibrioformis TaxID=34031 RepID=UPI0005598A69|nr:hypothetical protein [Desulfobacter vibrioformis]
MAKTERKKIDLKKLLEAIKGGVEQAEIIKQFGLSSSTQLKALYAKALIEADEIPKIQGAGRTKKTKPVNMNVKINKRGSLIIKKEIINTTKYDVDQKFTVKETPSGFQLKLVKDEPASKTNK